MIAKNRLTLLLILCMICIACISNAQSSNESKITIDLVFEDADGKQHTETQEYVGKEAEDFDVEAYEKSLESRGIKVLNLNINQSVSKNSTGKQHDIKIKQKQGKSKKSVKVKKIVISDTKLTEDIHESIDSDTYKVEEKDGKIYLNGKAIEGDSKQIRIMKTMEDGDDMKVEVKDGKVFINGEEVDDSEINTTSQKRVIVKSMNSDDDIDMNVEVKDGKVYINGEEVDDAEMNQSSGHRVIIKKIDGDEEKNTWISDDGEAHDLHKKGNNMIFISDDVISEDILNKNHGMIFMTDDAPKPRLGIMIEDGKEVNGAEIIDLVADSPAAKAGLKKGDTVTAINGNPVYGVTSMMDKVSDFKAGEEVSVTYNRDGKTMTSKIKLEVMDTKIEKEVIIIKE